MSEPRGNHLILDKIELSADKSYELREVAELVKFTLDFVSREAQHDSLSYSASDVYWILHDLLRYINARTKGEFILKRLKKGAWRLQYDTETTAQKKANVQRQKELDETADYIEDLTGQRPPWA